MSINIFVSHAKIHQRVTNEGSKDNLLTFLRFIFHLILFIIYFFI